MYNQYCRYDMNTIKYKDLEIEVDCGIVVTIEDNKIKITNGKYNLYPQYPIYPGYYPTITYNS